jgi:hypothetical protein
MLHPKNCFSKHVSAQEYDHRRTNIEFTHLSIKLYIQSIHCALIRCAGVSENVLSADTVRYPSKLKVILETKKLS